jgi:putative DNA primase/helicase
MEVKMSKKAIVSKDEAIIPVTAVIQNSNEEYTNKASTASIAAFNKLIEDKPTGENDDVIDKIIKADTKELMKMLEVSEQDILEEHNELVKDIPAGEERGGNFDKASPKPSIPKFTEERIGRVNKERFKGGTLTLYHYHNSKGAPVACVVRCDFEDKDKQKTFAQYSYNHIAQKWQSGWSEHGKPPYNLQEIIAHPDKPVMVVEGEKVVETAKYLFPEFVLTTSCMGAGSARSTNWSFLRGRDVVIAPDNDRQGAKYTKDLSDILTREEVKSISGFDAKKLGRFIIIEGKPTRRDEPVPEKYDLADSVADGWTLELITEWKTHADFSPFFEAASDVAAVRDLPKEGEEVFYIGGVNYKLSEKSNSLWWEKVETNARTGDTITTWLRLSGYMKPTHCTVDANGNHGLLVKIVTINNKAVDCFFAREEFATEKDTTKLLLAKGLPIPHLKPANCYALNFYLNNFKPEFKAVGIDMVGWQPNQSTYVLPFIDDFNNSYTCPREGEKQVTYILQQKGAASRILKRKGTLEEWQRTVGAVIKGNYLHSFSVLAALAAPALKLLGEEGGFFHYAGSTSIGKSTILHVAKSVWGFENLGSFRTTDNALESACKNANDGMLFLDEIGEVAPDALSNIVYMVANGSTKGRSDRGGEAKGVSYFTVLAQSAGETGLEAKLAEKGKKAKGGQLMRMAELDADRGKDLNTFDVLNINPDTGKLFGSGKEQAEYLKTHAKENCGVVIDSFLKLVVPNVDSYVNDLKVAKATWLQRKFTGKEGAEVTRMAKRFSTIYASGVIAVNAGILPLTLKDIDDCVSAIFTNWFERFGGDSSYEFKAIVADLRELVIEHKYARFCNANPMQDERENQPKEIAGYWHAEKKEVWIYPSVFKRDVLKGRDDKVFYPLLVKEGYLKKEDARQYASLRQSTKVDRQRFMVVDFSVLSPEED